MTIKAQCLCKSVTLELKDPPTRVGVCHCNMCRNWGGGPMMTIEAGSSVSISGDPVKVFDSSDWAERGFCGSCGSHLFYRFKATGDTYLPVGLFAVDQVLFDHEIFIDEKPQWYDFANDTKKMTGAQVIAMFTGSDL